MKYLFLLGRNPELSTEEVKSFLEKEEIKFRIIREINNGILIETDRKIPKIIDRLGGTISIGEVLADGDAKDIIQELENKILYSVSRNKLNYIVYNFNGENPEEILSYLKRRFRDEGLKATEKKPTGRIKIQEGKEIPKVSSNLIDEQYFIFEDNFGRITQKSNYEEIEKRDMGKPVRRNELSISPRLAKIMINLSQIRKGETLLDPFCGIGTILQEALLQDIKVIGIDKDGKAIHDARLNLKWFKFRESNYRLINEDSSKIKISEIQGIATEPNLGELQKKSPSPEKAKQAINEFEELIIKVLRNLKRYVKGRIVFTAPLILAGKKRISCSLEKISSETGLNIIGNFNEFRENSIVGRSIIVAGR